MSSKERTAIICCTVNIVALCCIHSVTFY